MNKTQTLIFGIKTIDKDCELLTNIELPIIQFRHLRTDSPEIYRYVDVSPSVSPAQFLFAIFVDLIRKSLIGSKPRQTTDRQPRLI